MGRRRLRGRKKAGLSKWVEDCEQRTNDLQRAAPRGEVGSACWLGNKETASTLARL